MIYIVVTVGVVHTLVSTGIIKVVEDGYQDVQYITALQDIEQELLQHKMAMAQWSSYTVYIQLLYTPDHKH